MQQLTSTSCKVGKRAVNRCCACLCGRCTGHTSNLHALKRTFSVQLSVSSPRELCGSRAGHTTSDVPLLLPVVRAVHPPTT